MLMPRTIQPDGWTIHDNGDIQRHDVPAPYDQPSGQWRITGAVTLDNFGHVARRWTLADILADPGAIPWKFKNGKQRTHLTDCDHGSHRVRMSPGHSVI
jgi:hypothetical protein